MARGPAYPYVNLDEAVTLVRKLYEYAKRGTANLTAVIKEKWEYSPTSSTSIKSLAALRYYGLVEVIENGDKGDSIKITDRAYRILVDSPESPERKRALVDAVLSPKAYKLCWDTWGADMPASMRSSLIFEHGFNENTVDGFIADYRKSVQFAGLLDGGVTDGGEDQTNSEQKSSGKDAGSVQSTIIKPPAPTAAPTSAPAADQQVLRGAGMGGQVFAQKGVGMRQEVFALAEGDVTIQWPERLSAESLEDFTDWLRILERKIKRASRPQQQPVTGGGRERVKLDDDDEASGAENAS